MSTRFTKLMILCKTEQKILSFGATLFSTCKYFLFLTVQYFRFGQGKEQDKCLNILHTFTKKVIEERRQELEASGWRLEGRRAFLDLLLEMAHKGDFPMEDIAGEVNEIAIFFQPQYFLVSLFLAYFPPIFQVDTFLFEGHDTTATALSWALHLVGNYPEVQAKIQQELDEVLGESNYVSIEDLSKLNYLEAVVKVSLSYIYKFSVQETLRLYPSVPIVVRELGEDENFHGTVVPKGTIILINLMLVQRDPIEWPEPDKFKPERFVILYLIILIFKTYKRSKNSCLFICSFFCWKQELYWTTICYVGNENITCQSLA